MLVLPKWLSGKDYSPANAGDAGDVTSLGQEYPLEKEMADNSTILVQKIPRTEEPDGL